MSGPVPGPGATFQALVAEGDKWLAQARATYTEGGGVQSAAAEAAIAQGYYLRAGIEKPDAMSALLAAQRAYQQEQQQAVRIHHREEPNQ